MCKAHTFELKSLQCSSKILFEGVYLYLPPVASVDFSSISVELLLRPTSPHNWFSSPPSGSRCNQPRSSVIGARHCRRPLPPAMPTPRQRSCSLWLPRVVSFFPPLP
ncbi:hypothetical protein GUJ93_ZPchr0013g34369 [Zizania palustris]|uniref:Uncharacterized protein n=1 Tax=Zizania palustris TaxID=103762 RepID=A0A8J5WS20_ZIZPA|nr:hypothetical protein GUJ93_ZPchr0013g34369 [Zizania palustris]